MTEKSRCFALRSADVKTLLAGTELVEIAGVERRKFIDTKRIGLSFNREVPTRLLRSEYFIFRNSLSGIHCTRQ